MTTVIKPPRLFDTLYAGNGSLFSDLVAQLDDCSEQFTQGCRECPHFKICVAWWDLHVCEYLAQFTLRQDKFDSLTQRFKEISMGQYKGNGRKRTGGSRK